MTSDARTFGAGYRASFRNQFSFSFSKGTWPFVLALAGTLATAVSSFPGVALAAGAEVTATVDRNQLGPEDTLTFTVSVTSSEEVSVSQPTLPNLADFEVLNQWTSQEARANFVNTPNGPQFKTVRSMRYNYALQPKREGRLPIGASEVVVEGKTYLTKPITITVSKSAAGAPPPRRGGQNPNQLPGGVQPPPGFFDDEEDDLFSQLLRRGLPNGSGGGGGASKTLPINPNEAFFVHVETDKTEAFVGEQVTASWYLYTRGQIRDLDTLKYPSLRGFWKEDIEIATHLNFTQDVVNGLPYKRALLASFALFPMKEGTTLIDSYTAKCTVIPAVDALSGAFGMGKAYTFTKSSQPMKIAVKAVPTEGRPPEYTGAVGDFQVSARVEDTNVVDGQPFTFKIRFEGKGNAKLIDIPPFEPPEGLELYETQKEAKFFRTGTSYKDFSILLIPRRQGEFSIPPIKTSIFDPIQKKFVTKATEPVRVIVGKGQALPQGSKSLQLEQAKKAQGPVSPQLQLEYKAHRPFSNAEKGIGFAAVMALASFGLFFKARNEMGWGQKRKDLVRRMRTRLRRVDERMAKNDWRGVGVEMTNATYFVLGEISGQGGANVEFEKLMLKAPPSVRRELAEPFAKQMETFQVLSFAPEAVLEGFVKDPSQVKKAIKEMEALLEKAVQLGVSSGQSDES